MLFNEPFKPHHMKELREQGATAYLRPWIVENAYELLAEGRNAYTLRAIGSGKIVACAGLADMWQGRAEAWALISEDCKEHFLALHNTVKNFLESCEIKRIEAVVDFSFAEGHRWIRALGFELEALEMKAYRPNGSSASLYARVR